VGTVFTLNTSGGSYGVLHHFSAAAGEGQNPVPNLIEGCDGALYGTTYSGGGGGGTVFKLNKNGSDYAVVYSFPGATSDGWGPYGPLLMASDNAIYGTTRFGGTNNLGTIFKLSWPWPFDAPIVWDACCGTNVTLGHVDATNGFCPWLVTRTWTATDYCTNSTNCSQTLTVVDTRPPTIVCPTNMTVITCATNVQVFWSLTAYDICCPVTVTSTPPSGSWFGNRTTNTVICTATDCCSNLALCAFSVIIQPPLIEPSITYSGGIVTINWPGGVLVYKDDLTPGPWPPVPGASPPSYSTPASQAHRFYRVRCE
jgi:uncharacterized repeat protein (TIGR03803 family)